MAESKKSAVPHPKSRELFMITIIVVVLTALGLGYYAYNINEKSKANKVTEDLRIKDAETEAIIIEKERADKITTAELKADVAALDVTEIKEAVADLKAAMGAFQGQ